MIKKLERVDPTSKYRPEFRPATPELFDSNKDSWVYYYRPDFKKLYARVMFAQAWRGVPLEDLIAYVTTRAQLYNAAHWSIFQDDKVVAKSENLWPPAHAAKNGGTRRG